MTAPQDLQARALAAWRARHPGSRHRALEWDELEARKRENEARAALDARERPDVCRAYPSFLTVGNTHKCNLTCRMCFKQLDDADNMSLPDMGLARFERVAHELFPHLRRVALSVTGEPLVSRTILAELELLVSYGVRAAITTNGMPLAKPGLIAALLPATEALTVSMDGASPATFAAIRRGADFHRVVRNVRLFDEARDALPPDAPRPELRFNHILQRRNLTELPRLVELAAALHVDALEVDHVYVHEGLNEEDSLAPHRRLANRVVEEAREVAERLGVRASFPAPFDEEGLPPDEPYAPPGEAELLAHARERPRTTPFDPAVHERWRESHRRRALDEVRAAGGGNAALVERLLDERALLGHLRWGVPQLGESLIPPEERAPSACTYPWAESFVEYNGLVAACCNAAMDVARILGDLGEEESFLDVWNGPAYRRLRRSLRTGACYGFCRTCYLFEPPSRADWGTSETLARLRVEARADEPAEVGQAPPGRRVALRSLAATGLPAGASLELRAGGRPIARCAPLAGEAPLPAEPLPAEEGIALCRDLGALPVPAGEVLRVVLRGAPAGAACRVELVVAVA